MMEMTDHTCNFLFKKASIQRIEAQVNTLEQRYTQY